MIKWIGGFFITDGTMWATGVPDDVTMKQLASGDVRSLEVETDDGSMMTINYNTDYTTAEDILSTVEKMKQQAMERA